VQHSKIARRKVAQGLVSRVSPVQTALRNCTRDEDRSFEFGNQVLISSHRKLAVVKSDQWRNVRHPAECHTLRSIIRQFDGLDDRWIIVLQLVDAG
jgi:hypothetical protein